MMQRLLYGWTMRRVMYLVMGAIFTWYFIGEKEYVGAGLGVLFALMAVFNMGCAAGNCASGACRNRSVDTYVEGSDNK